MRVKNSYLYWGVFLLALGGAIAAFTYLQPEPAAVVDLLRYWPLVVIAFGVGLVLRRTQFNVAGGMLAAAVPGLLLGSAIAVGPQVGWDCAPPRQRPDVVARGSRHVQRSRPRRCHHRLRDPHDHDPSGLRLGPAGGQHQGYAPVVDASTTDLSLRSVRDDRWFGDYGRDEWGLTLPTSRIDDLNVVVNAGEGQTDLDGADIGALALTTNAGRSTVDLATARVESIAAAVNAGQLSIDLPTGDDVRGTISVNAGDAEVCVPDTVGVRVRSSGTFSSTDLNGLALRDGAWESPDYASAAHHADLTVSVNLGSLDFNPVGGCS